MTALPEEGEPAALDLGGLHGSVLVARWMGGSAAAGTSPT
jgi:hypothetical protein